MTPVEFKSTIPALTGDGRVLIALFDGEQGGKPTCVGILICGKAAAAAHSEAVGSLLKSATK